MTEKPLISYKVRLIALFILFISFFILIWIQIFNLQVIRSSGIITEVYKQYYKKPIVLRGDIRDRNGNLLVLDIITYDIYNNAANLERINKEKIKLLASFLNVQLDELQEKLKTKINTRIFTSINEETIEKIKNAKINFVYSVPRATRKYPHGKLASHIIGFVNNDHKGQHGVEYFYDKLLSKPTQHSQRSEPFLKGTSIVLTIDSILQEFAEEELEKAIKESKADKGAIIILSPKNGEIYSFAVYPNFNPNIFYKEKNIKNWAITDVYEPGSTFKIITISSAIENNTIDTKSKYFDPGYIKVDKRIIRNHEKHEPRSVDLIDLFRFSSNVAAAQVGLSMKPKDFYTAIKSFMLGEKTKIDLPGESSGILIKPNKWKKLELATTAIGQGAISVTPIQLASAISAIANHGIWTQPHVLKGTWDPDYLIINKTKKTTLKSIAVSQETADFISSLLKQSVRKNLESMAYIGGNVPGYVVAGKTGTAQKIRPDGKGYLPGHTIASFIGYLPADDPEILILVVIDDPKTLGRWGNTIAGPVFNSVAKMAVKRVIENL